MDRWLMNCRRGGLSPADDALPEPERHDGGAVGDLEALRGCDLEAGGSRRCRRSRSAKLGPGSSAGGNIGRSRAGRHNGRRCERLKARLVAGNAGAGRRSALRTLRRRGLRGRGTPGQADGAARRGGERLARCYPSMSEPDGSGSARWPPRPLQRPRRPRPRRARSGSRRRRRRVSLRRWRHRLMWPRRRPGHLVGDALLVRSPSLGS